MAKSNKFSLTIKWENQENGGVKITDIGYKNLVNPNYSVVDISSTLLWYALDNLQKVLEEEQYLEVKGKIKAIFDNYI